MGEHVLWLVKCMFYQLQWFEKVYCLKEFRAKWHHSSRVSPVFIIHYLISYRVWQIGGWSSLCMHHFVNRVHMTSWQSHRDQIPKANSEKNIQACCWLFMIIVEVGGNLVRPVVCVHHWGSCLHRNMMAFSFCSGYEVVWRWWADHGSAWSNQRVVIKTAPFPSGGGARSSTTDCLQKGIFISLYCICWCWIHVLTKRYIHVEMESLFKIFKYF